MQLNAVDNTPISRFFRQSMACKAIMIMVCLIQFGNLQAQLDEDCFSAGIICIYEDFANGSTWTLPGGGAGLSCNSIDVDNPLFLPFQAGPGDVTFSALATTCNPGSGATGVILTVFDGCPGFVAPECISSTMCQNYPLGLGNIPIELTVFDAELEDGQIYYLAISGCNGAVCDFELDISGESLIIPALDGNETTLEVEQCTEDNLGENVYCAGASVFMYADNPIFDNIGGEWFWSIEELDALADASTVSWVADARSGSGNPIQNGNIPFLVYGNNEITFTFEFPGEYRICLDEFQTRCDSEEGPLCVDITIIPDAEPAEVGPYNICIRELEFLGWDGPDSPDPEGDEWVGGPITLEDVLDAEQDNDDLYYVERVSEENDCGCSYDQTLIVNLVGGGDPGEAELYLTECQLPYTWFDLTIFELEDFNGEEVALVGGSDSQDYKGTRCDSFVVVNINEVVIPDTIFLDDCANGNQLFTFELLEIEVKIGNSFEDIGFFGLRYQWIDSTTGNFITPLTDNPTTALDDGTYYVYVTGFMDDINHNATSQGTSPNSFVECTFGPFQIVNPIIPPPSLAPYDNFLCHNETENQVFTILNPDRDTRYIWDIPPQLAAEVSFNQDTTILTVSDIAQIGTSTISVIAETDCGSSVPTNINVEVSEPAIFIPPNIGTCISDPAFISGYGPNNNYTWNFEGLAPIVSNGNPFEVNFNSSGIIDYTVTIEDANGCITDLGPFSATVSNEIVEPILLCEDVSTPGSIIINYEHSGWFIESITVEPPFPFSDTNSSFVFENLPANTELELTIVVIYESFCQTQTTTSITCITDDCDLPPADLGNFEDIEFCQGEPIANIQFDVTPPLGMIGRYEGPGIDSGGLLDLGDPTFDLPGDYVIQYIYSDNISGCSETESITVSVIPNIEIENINIPDLCPGDDFELIPQVSGGDGSGYIFSWPNASDPTFNISTDSNTPSGSNTILLAVSDNSCYTEIEFNYTVLAVPDQVLNVNAINVCNDTPGDHPTTLDLNEFIDPSLFGEWYLDNSLVSDPDNLDFSGMLSTTSTLEFIPDPSFECLDDNYFIDVLINDCGCPLFEAIVPEVLCAENNQVLLFTNLEGNWSSNNQELSFDNLNNLIISSNTSAGVYELNFEIRNPLIGCLQDTNFFLTIDEPPFAEFQNDISICNSVIGTGQTAIDLDTLLVAGSNGTWSDSSGALNIDADNIVSFENLATGNYRIQYNAVSANSCSDATFEIDIRVRDCSCIDFDIATIDPQCSDQVLNLESFLINPDNLSGSWTIDGVASEAQINLNDLSEGAFEIAYILDQSLGGNCNDTARNTLIIDAAPGLILTENQFTLCNDPSASVYPSTIDLQALNQGTPGNWTAPPNYNNGIINDPSLVDFEGQDFGSYIFQLESMPTSNDACNPQIENIIIEVIDCSCPIIVVQDDVICNDANSFDLNRLISTETDDGNWTFINGPETVSFEDDNNIQMPQQAGIYEFEYQLSVSQLGCEDSGIAELEIIEFIELETIVNLQACDILNGQEEAIINLESFSNGVDGNWDFPSNYNGDISDLSSISFVGASSGTYEFRFTSSQNCTTPESIVSIEVIPCCLSFEVDYDIQASCLDGNTGSIGVTNIEGGTGNYSYNLNGSNSIDGSFESLIAGNYELIIEDDSGCITKISDINIPSHPELIVDLGQDVEVLITQNNYEVLPNINLNEDQIFQFLWTTNGEIICDGLPTECASLLVDLDIVSEVCLEVIDINGCDDLDCVTITPVIPQRLYIPTVFTPLGNQNNSFFLGSDQYLESIQQFKIYDRWGNLVFDAGDTYVANDPNLGWNGTKEGNDVAQGVYVYFIEATFEGEAKSETYTGSITLLR